MKEAILSWRILACSSESRPVHLWLQFVCCRDAPLRGLGPKGASKHCCCVLRKTWLCVVCAGMRTGRLCSCGHGVSGIAGCVASGIASVLMCRGIIECSHVDFAGAVHGVNAGLCVVVVSAGAFIIVETVLAGVAVSLPHVATTQMRRVACFSMPLESPPWTPAVATCIVLY